MPPLELPVLDWGPWRLSDQKPQNFVLLIFYRGSHCSNCQEWMGDFEQNYSAFRQRGIRIIAVSSDDETQARHVRQVWGLESIDLAYGLTEADAHAWGLVMTHGTDTGTPERFNEPALFLVHPDGALFGHIQLNSPFGRPRIEDLLAGIDSFLASNPAVADRDTRPKAFAFA